MAVGNWISIWFCMCSYKKNQNEFIMNHPGLRSRNEFPVVAVGVCSKYERKNERIVTISVVTSIERYKRLRFDISTSLQGYPVLYYLHNLQRRHIIFSLKFLLSYWLTMTRLLSISFRLVFDLSWLENTPFFEIKNPTIRLNQTFLDSHEASIKGIGENLKNSSVLQFWRLSLYISISSLLLRFFMKHSALQWNIIYPKVINIDQ